MLKELKRNALISFFSKLFRIIRFLRKLDFKTQYVKTQNHDTVCNFENHVGVKPVCSNKLQEEHLNFIVFIILPFFSKSFFFKLSQNCDSFLCKRKNMK